MIRMQDIMKTLPLVASVLGDKYGVQVEVGGKSAYTDGKSIHLPSLPLDCNSTLLHMARAYIDHEAAHLRDTDFGLLREANFTPMQKHIWNTLEDRRVEQHLASLFPGCRQNLDWLIQHLFADDNDYKAGGTSPAFFVLDWILLSVRAWDVPAVVPPRDACAVMVEQAFPGLLSKLDRVLQLARTDCLTPEDAIRFALELSEIIEQEAKQNTPDSADSSASIDPTDSDTKTALPDSPPAQPATQPISLREVIEATEDKLPRHVGELLAERLNGQEQNGPDRLCVAQEQPHLTFPLPPEDLRESQRTSTALRTRLQGFLQADSLTPCISGRRGRINPKNLYGLAISNPRVFLKPGERKRLDTAVHILLDASGSMQGRPIQLANQGCHALASALELCGVNVGVTIFPGPTTEKTSTVAPLVRHGERVHTRFDTGVSGSTPLAPALWWVMQQLLPLKEPRKLIVILTDGAPNSFPAAQEAIASAAKLGFEVYGLGICESKLAALLPQHSRIIHNLNELTPALFEMLQTALLRQ